MKKTYVGTDGYRSMLSVSNTQKKRRFRSLIITKSAIVTAVSIISAAVFLITAWMLLAGVKADNTEKFLKAGISSAMPFLSVKADNSLKAMAVRFISDMFGADITAPKEIAVSSSPILIVSKSSTVKSEKMKSITVKKSNNISEKNVSSHKLSIKNETKYSVDAEEFLKTDVKFDISPKYPSVLIVHTHGSESYTPSTAYNYEPTSNYRTQDNKYNMIRVGNEIENYLKRGGINVIHDKTINDYPSYNDSYNKTEKVIKQNLEKYPTVKIVLDIHRDAVGDDQNGVKFTTSVNGEKAAQVMIVCGSDQNLENPYWQTNFAFALKIQQYFEKEYPMFLRPLNLRKERFNMHLTKGSLLFEVGTNYNTLDEALSSARILGSGLADVIKELSQR